VGWVPAVGIEPVHPPEAVHELASVELHCNMDVLPPAMLVGEALSATVGAATEPPLLLPLLLLPPLLLLSPLLPPPHATRMRHATATTPMFTPDLKLKRASPMRAILARPICQLSHSNRTNRRPHQ
jgi:hypothetical protein